MPKTDYQPKYQFSKALNEALLPFGVKLVNCNAQGRAQYLSSLSKQELIDLCQPSDPKMTKLEIITEYYILEETNYLIDL